MCRVFKLLLISINLFMFTCGSTDETLSGIKTAGLVIDEFGKPVSGASVKIFAVGDTSRIPISITKTDIQGHYELMNTEKGYFNVWAQKEFSAGLRDSVFLKENDNVIEQIIIKKVGSICGNISIQPQHDPRIIYVQALGTQAYTNVDSLGQFCLDNLAEGKYTLKFTSEENAYVPRFINVNIISDSVLSLTEPVVIFYNSIPVVQGIKADFDTVGRAVKISFNKTSYREFDYYKIVRAHLGQSINDAVEIGTTDTTVFIDSLLSDEVNGYSYWIAIVNKMGDQGQYYYNSNIKILNPENVELIPVDRYIYSPAVTLRWHPCKYTNSYRVKLFAQASSDSLIFEASTSDTFMNCTIPFDGPYVWQVEPKGKYVDWGRPSLQNQFGFKVFTEKLNMNHIYIIKETDEKDFVIIGSDSTGIIFKKIDLNGNRKLFKKIISTNGDQILMSNIVFWNKTFVFLYTSQVSTLKKTIYSVNITTDGELGVKPFLEDTTDNFNWFHIKDFSNDKIFFCFGKSDSGFVNAKSIGYMSTNFTIAESKTIQLVPRILGLSCFSQNDTIKILASAISSFGYFSTLFMPEEYILYSFTEDFTYLKEDTIRGLSGIPSYFTSDNENLMFTSYHYGNPGGLFLFNLNSHNNVTTLMNVPISNASMYLENDKVILANLKFENSNPINDHYKITEYGINGNLSSEITMRPGLKIYNFIKTSDSRFLIYGCIGNHYDYLFMTNRTGAFLNP